MAKKPAADEAHIHHFRSFLDPALSWCACGMGTITPEEYDLRRDLWQVYYEEVKGTKAYRLAQAMNRAFKVNDRPRLAKLLAFSKTRIKRVGETWERLVPLELTKPPFKDPTSQNLYFVEDGQYIAPPV